MKNLIHIRDILKSLKKVPLLLSFLFLFYDSLVIFLEHDSLILIYLIKFISLNLGLLGHGALRLCLIPFLLLTKQKDSTSGCTPVKNSFLQSILIHEKSVNLNLSLLKYSNFVFMILFLFIYINLLDSWCKILSSPLFHHVNSSKELDRFS